MPFRDPAWDTPAKMDGLPYTNWKRRSGHTETGTVAAMVQRWLGLAWHVQAGCFLSWGPDAEGRTGGFQAEGIGAFVLRVGLPPAMLKGRSRPPTREEIERYWAKPAPLDLFADGPVHFNPYRDERRK